jgi:hypothetical protein
VSHTHTHTHTHTHACTHTRRPFISSRQRVLGCPGVGEDLLTCHLLSFPRTCTPAIRTSQGPYRQEGHCSGLTTSTSLIFLTVKCQGQAALNLCPQPPLHNQSKYLTSLSLSFLPCKVQFIDLIPQHHRENEVTSAPLHSWHIQVVDQ